MALTAHFTWPIFAFEYLLDVNLTPSVGRRNIRETVCQTGSVDGFGVETSLTLPRSGIRLRIELPGRYLEHSKTLCMYLFSKGRVFLCVCVSYKKHFLNDEAVERTRKGKAWPFLLLSRQRVFGLLPRQNIYSVLILGRCPSISSGKSSAILGSISDPGARGDRNDSGGNRLLRPGCISRAGHLTPTFRQPRRLRSSDREAGRQVVRSPLTSAGFGRSRPKRTAFPESGARTARNFWLCQACRFC